MTPREFVAVIRERWRVVVGCIVLGLLVAGAATLLAPRLYATDTTLVISSNEPDPNATTALDMSEMSAQRMRTYIELLTSRELARQVVADLALPLQADEVAAMITAENPPDTTILTATVTDRDPNRAVLVADSVASVFVATVADLEQPADPARAPLVVASVYAEPPAAWTVSPRPGLYLSLGVLLGLVAGLGAALLLHALDDSVRSRRALEDVLVAPVRGVVPHQRAVARRPLAILDRPHEPAAEAARQLRTNLGFVGTGLRPPGPSDGDRGHTVLLVTSAVRGEGRTTTVCHLGLALVAAGYRVLLVDADLRRPSLAERLGVADGSGLVGVLTEHRPLERAIRTWEPGLDVLPGGPVPFEPSELLGSPAAANVLAQVRDRYDVVLVDAPPVLPVTDAAVIAPRVDGVLLVVRHGRTSRTRIREAQAALDAVSAHLVGAVLTMARSTSVGGYPQRRTQPRAGRAQQVEAGADPAGAQPHPPQAESATVGDLAANGAWRPSPRPRPRPATDGGPAVPWPGGNGH
jgi:non-specific protein-tyrosine kinase